MVNAKHLATFLLGAAAGAAFLKYHQMTDAEKTELTDKFKAKADELKTEASAAADKMEDYFSELQQKGGEAMKDFMANAEKFMQDFFNKDKENNSEKA